MASVQMGAWNSILGLISGHKRSVFELSPIRQDLEAMTGDQRGAAGVEPGAQNDIAVVNVREHMGRRPALNCVPPEAVTS